MHSLSNTFLLICKKVHMICIIYYMINFQCQKETVFSNCY